MRRLLTRRADANRRLTWGGVDWTQLAVALWHRGTDSVAALLEHGADPNARWCTSFARPAERQPYVHFEDCTPDRGLTPLMAAASRGNVAAIRSLLTHGADPSLTDWKGRTARDHARDAKQSAEYDEA